MTALIFIGGIIWGSLSAQFLVQTITSLIIASINVVALAFSKVPKNMNAGASLVSLVQAIVFAALFIGGNWFTSYYFDYATWNATSIASLIAFLGTLIYCALQIPDKIIFAKLCAWAPFFRQAAMHRPQHELAELARRYRANPTVATLYEPLQSAPPPQDRSP
jgi:hypothetical protein